MQERALEDRHIRRQAGLYKEGKGFLSRILFPHYDRVELDASYRHAVLAPFIESVRRKTDEPRALDVGAGKGEVTKHLRKHGVAVTPVDVNAVVLEDAEGVQAPAWRLPETFTAGFDGAHMKDVLVHIPTSLRKEFFMEMKRVLKPGGVLLICSAHNAFNVDLQYPVFRKDVIAGAEECGFTVESNTVWKPHASAKDWYPRGFRRRFVLALRSGEEGGAAGA
jgi:SAM-dependent methyltransferase